MSEKGKSSGKILKFTLSELVNIDYYRRVGYIRYFLRRNAW